MSLRALTRATAAALLLALLGVAPALAQGCGPTNPNCIVPTRPIGDNTNAAASTAFVQASLALAVTSVRNVDGTLTISPTIGAVVASLNLTHANTWTAAQAINESTGALLVTGVLSLQAADTVSSGLTVNSSAVGSGLYLERTDGTFASKSLVQSGDFLGSLSYGGYDGTSVQTATALIRGKVTANFAHGTDYETSIQILATPPSSIASELEATFQAGLVVGAATGGAKGVGTVNATNFYLNGTAIDTAAAVNSVSNSDGTLTISPTTAAVVASLALGHANIWTAILTVNLNAATLPTSLTGTGLRLGGANGVASRVENDAFGAAPYFSIVRTDGTNAAKTALLNADEIGGFNAWGYNGSAVVGPTAAFRTWANENWSSGHQGSYADIAATPNGTTSEISVVQIVPSSGGGQVLVGNKPYENISGGQFTATYLMSIATLGVAQTSSGIAIVGTALQDGANGYNFPTGLTGDCKLDYSGYDCQASNNVVDMMTAGIGSNENDINNWFANPPTAYPPVYANPTIGTYGQGLYLGCGGTYKCYAGVLIGQNANAGAGAVWQAGIYMWPGTVGLYGELIDATSSAGPTNSIYSRSVGSSGQANLTLQEMGSNANGIMMKMLDATGPPVLAIDANGFVTNYLLTATGTVFGVNDALGSQQAVVGFMELANEKWALGMDTNGSFLAYDVVNANAFLRVTTAGLLKLGENAALQITTAGVSTFGYQTVVNESSAALFSSTGAPFVVQNVDGSATSLGLNASANVSQLFLFRTDGTFASPTGLQSSDVIGALIFGGYDGTASHASTAQIKALTSANWVNGSDYETKIQILATPPSATAPEIEATFQGGMFVGAATGGAKGVGTVNATAFYVNGTALIGLTSISTGLTNTSGALTSNATEHVSFQPGLMTSVSNAKAAFHKYSKASTVDNIEGSAQQFSCTGNPTITMYECGTSTTCATPTTIGSVTVTAAGAVVDGSISSAAITAGDYIAFAVSAGTCITLDVAATAQVHQN